jgi:hypothetical protein
LRECANNGFCSKLSRQLQDEDLEEEEEEEEEQLVKSKPSTKARKKTSTKDSEIFTVFVFFSDFVQGVFVVLSWPAED